MRANEKIISILLPLVVTVLLSSCVTDPTTSPDWDNREICEYVVQNQSGSSISLSYVAAENDSLKAILLNDKDSVSFYTVDSENLLSVWEKPSKPSVENEIKNFRELIVLTDTVLIIGVKHPRTETYEAFNKTTGVYKLVCARSVRHKINHPNRKTTQADLIITIKNDIR